MITFNMIEQAIITPKHNGLININCTALPGKTCSIINAYGSALLNNIEELPWTAGYCPIYNSWQFVADCTNLCSIGSASAIGIKRISNNLLIPTDTFYGCVSQIQSSHIWTENLFNVNTANWLSAIIF